MHKTSISPLGVLDIKEKPIAVSTDFLRNSIVLVLCQTSGSITCDLKRLALQSRSSDRTDDDCAKSAGMSENDLGPLDNFHESSDGKIETSVSLAERARQREIQGCAIHLSITS
jgi:hypothetical protein